MTDIEQNKTREQLLFQMIKSAQAYADSQLDGEYIITCDHKSDMGTKDFYSYSEYIIAKICKAFELDYHRFAGRDRRRNYADARKMYCHYIKTNVSYVTKTQIGNSINKDHATVIHSLNRHSALMETDKEYRARYDQLCYILD